jgi:Domain of unknown function (DUF4129)
MTSAGARRRVGVAVQAAPVAFAVVAEGAWVSIAAALVAVYALSESPPGLPLMTAVVAAGVVAAWLGARIAGSRWPTLAAALAIVVGAAGWLAPAEVRAELSERGVAAALGLNPAGWLAGLALVRGFRHARLPLHEPTLATLLAVGVPAIALAAVAGGMIAEPFRGRFLADTLVAATVFAASGTLGLALARLTAIGSDAGFDWRRNPPWLALAAVLVVAAAAVAIPASAVAGPLITVVLGILAGPFLLIALIVGFTRRAAWFVAIAAGVTVVYVALVALLAGDPAELTPATGGGGEALPPQPAGDEVLAVAGIVLVVAAAVISLLVRLWMRRPRPADADPGESRTIDRGETGGRRASRHRRWFRRRRPVPVDAVTAYRALDEDLRATNLRRLPDETPAEHARRLRSRGLSRLALDLLAADYALARFGGVTLSAAENRRAVDRWRSLRRELAVRAGPR